MWCLHACTFLITNESTNHFICTDDESFYCTNGFAVTVAFVGSNARAVHISISVAIAAPNTRPDAFPN